MELNSCLCRRNIQWMRGMKRFGALLIRVYVKPSFQQKLRWNVFILFFLAWHFERIPFNFSGLEHPKNIFRSPWIFFRSVYCVCLCVRCVCLFCMSVRLAVFCISLHGRRAMIYQAFMVKREKQGPAANNASSWILGHILLPKYGNSHLWW